MTKGILQPPLFDDERWFAKINSQDCKRQLCDLEIARAESVAAIGLER